ncbi:MAG: DUF3810 domain-containing protein [Bacteroidota bacterium]|nr:DUF3810 domain-containing protein [Bacteroidota bacterium]
MNEVWVERYYSTGVYLAISKTLRVLFGWIPFSIGDVIYIAAGILMLIKVWKLLLLLKHRRIRQHLTWKLLRKYLKLILFLYIVFNVFWGLNYYRQGISKQISINVQPYSVQDLFMLTTTLQNRLNFYAEIIDSASRLQYNKKNVLFDSGRAAYKNVQPVYSFLQYSNLSAKPSLFTPVARFMGFTGYYNPVTGEAQLKTSIPVFLKPFVITHEMAHQLGYAKENEASFVAYLACKNSGNANYLYSAYFEIYRDAMFDCIQTGDTLFVKNMSKNLHRRVRYDIHDLRLYLAHDKNFIEPFMSDAYDKYLRLNNQPNGKATYNEVIAYLIAFMKKFGKDAI